MSDRAALLEIATSTSASLAERCAAGDELASLGDPRATGVDRVAIPGGPFLAGPEGALREVVVHAFAIDRYPVTVARYAEFIDGGGYEDARHWSADGWAWRASERITTPRFWGETEWSSYLVSNHPVVGVSFFEAEAYAAFRSVRLPSEAEWEKACRSTDGRRYPWGSEWLDDACGIRDVGPRGTLPIGVFPRGVSPYGVWDMVGCVWQWCTDISLGPARATRGGAWNVLAWNLTATSVNAYPPAARYSNLGFRCVSEG